MNAAIVRIRQDMDKLGLWLSYYTKYFDDVYVVCAQTPDKATIDLHKKYKFKEIKTGSHIHSMEAHQIVFEKQEELLKDHDWVLYADSDEYVIPFKENGDLKNFMKITEKKQTFCDGYEVVRMDTEGLLDYSKPILSQRSMWYRDESGSYNKPALSAIKSDWVEGFHKLKSMSDAEIKEMKDTGLYMVHLNHVNDIMLDRRLEPIPDWIKGVL